MGSTSQNVLVTDDEHLPNLDVNWLIRSKKIDKAWQQSIKNTPKELQEKLTDDIPLHTGNVAANIDEVGNNVNSAPLKECSRRRSVSISNFKQNKSDSVAVVSDDEDYDTEEEDTDSNMPIRRTKSLSSAETNRRKQIDDDMMSKTKPKKPGFFKGLFGLRKTKPETDDDRSPAQRSRRSSTIEPKSDSNVKPSSNTSSRSGSRRPSTAPQNFKKISNPSISTVSLEGNSPKLNTRNEERPCSISPERNSERDLTTVDMKLLEFIDYYRKNGYKTNSFNKNSIIKQKSSRRKGATFSVSEAFHSSDDDDSDPENNNSKNKNNRVDAKGRPLPSLPSKSKFRPALKGYKVDKKSPEPSSGSSDDSNLSVTNNPSSPTNGSSSRFGNFLRKVRTGNISKTNSEELESLSDKIKIDLDVVPGLDECKPLKHVAFATTTYFNDPPQQICSKNPRKGEVEVKTDGSIVIHRLTAEEKKKILETTASGVVVGGTGNMKLLSKLDDEMFRRAYDRRNRTEDNEEDIKPPTGNSKNITIDGTGPYTHKSASNLTIDKPMTVRRSTGVASTPSLVSLLRDDSFDGEVFPPKNLKIPNDLVYTRCCHLREILSIPATLKQIKKGSTDPIPLLQLRNPKPSLVEVWSFSDFVAISPILCVSLDGITLSTEMLKIILSSIINKPKFEKLSLRNTVLDEEGWKLLCYFISKARSLVAIDLTMVPSIKTNVQKPAKSSLSNPIKRMECSLQNRSEMNWDLLTASIAVHGGLEEIVISGAEMSYQQFENFLDVACVNTERLGLAYNKLSSNHMKKLGKWVVSSKVAGLDIGYNDLNGKLKCFNHSLTDWISNKNQKTSFKYISLNSTNLEVEPDGTSDTSEPLRLISTLCYCDTLKFLDISNNPKMFPYCTRTLLNCLPIFVSLIRLHLDFEALDSTSVVILAEALPLCTNLNYLSMLGTKFDLAAAKALVNAVRKSNSLITLDLDTGALPPKISEKLSLYIMRNVQNEISKMESKCVNTSKPSSDQFTNIQEELSSLLSNKDVNSKAYKQSVSEFIIRSMAAREKLTKVVHDLFDLRLHGQLSREGKESLIRLCIIDSCFEKGIRLLKDRSPSTISIPKQSDEVSTIVSTVLNQETSRDVQSNDESLDGLSVTPAKVPVPKQFERTGHSVLLPFGSAEVENYFPDAHETEDFTENREKVVDEAHSQSREEGSVFKRSADFMKQLEESVVKTGMQINKTALTDAAESLDSDQIKEFLLKNDISTTVDVIDELHKQGYHLHDIFKKSDSKKTSMDKSAIITKEKESNDQSSDNFSDKSATITENSNVCLIDDSSLNYNSEEDDAIDAAYDEVLDNLERTRSHM
ncbi:hypothetical protein Kpol_1032p90 [Vanderwaltozyma polyspora DSM 70294]|uniref:MAP-homologous protein 1 n=1 Tax=Vanderwaltozyma polyspora (strain ATCC 22028 / DSM 70294 / BCRC 21397 / CBS 2163 / NBRC 10782 / NRRL Y-8283 / UCD 57-17) TaxID=436907 RepID=A7TH41_VANPO|nr:uncharacterized protein Kpol_1032p90 [Vanderwaltozyma polyspora DSM 70294]EDO18493.1 hypothetical protein Kpol_1032p90 [Vanderwaltozyma polyspora DSM 70294]